MRRRERGVTLIELIMVIAIGAVLMSGLVLFGTQLVRQGVLSRDTVIAYNLARLKMAEAETLDFALLTTVTLPDEASFPGYDLRREVTDIATAAGPVTLRRVDILVDYAGGTFAAPLARLVTYRHNLVRFGNGG